MATTWLIYQCPAEYCGEEIKVEAEIEPAEHGWGADADGNRGVDVPAYVYQPDTPSRCPVCNTSYTEDQLEQVTQQLELATRDWENR